MGRNCGRVPEKHKEEIIRLRRTEGLTYKILAERFGISLSTVAHTVRKASQKEEKDGQNLE